MSERPTRTARRPRPSSAPLNTRDRAAGRPIGPAGGPSRAVNRRSTTAPPPAASVREPESLEQRAAEITEILTSYYGEPMRPNGRVDPLSELVAVILSQHTSDLNSERAFDSLRARFPSWAAVREAPTAEVADAIRSGGLAVIKAPRIQRVLDQIQAARGELSLDFLADLSLDDARTFLRTLDGVGPKSAACVLLFSLDKPAMPVDTHVHRVAGRLGLIPPRTTADAAHEQLERMVPLADVYRFHVGLIQHGRKVCRAQRPRCAECPLNALCPYPGKSV